MNDKREIVSLRHRNNGNIHFIRVYSEDEECLFETGGNAWRKTAYHLRRNLAAMPHEGFGREIEARYSSEKYYPGYICVGKNPIKPDSMMAYSLSDGIMYNWEDYRFLDETPETPETYEYNGKTYLKSEFDARIAPLKPVEEK